MKNLGLYIHIPFCKTICMYCAFPVYANKIKQVNQYAQKIIKDIQQKKEKYKNYKIDTIYFGGGTPSLIDEKHIENILKEIQKNFHITKNPEITIELNPENITDKKIKKYKQLGINRFSIGIQTFKEKTLKKIARIHTKTTILNALNILKNNNIKNINADFIIGLPFQTLNSFKNDLKTILKYPITHLSIYFLSYDTKKIDYFIKYSPTEDTQIKMYKYACKKLKKHNFTHYEISAYAKNGYQCKHNLKYWTQKEYLGIGLGAHSYIKNKVWGNTKDFNKYLTTNNKEDILTLTKDIKKEDYLMLNLRLKTGINKNTYEKKFKDLKNLQQKIIPYKKTNHIKETKTTIHLTEKGFLIIDTILTTIT